MKKYRNLLVPAAAIVLLLVVFAVMKLGGTSGGKDSSSALCPIAYEHIVGIAWENEHGSFGFTKAGGWWNYDEDPAFPTDSAHIISLIKSLASLEAVPVEGSGLEGENYGLGDGAVSVSVTGSDGEKFTVRIGDLNSVSGQNYISTGNGELYMADAAFAAGFSGGIEECIGLYSPAFIASPTLIEYASGDSKVRIYKDESGGLAYTDEYVWFVGSHGDMPIDSYTVNEVIGLAQNLVWQGAETYVSSESELAAYGLDRPAAALTVGIADGECFTLSIGFAAGENSYYAMLDSVPAVYILDSYTAEEILAIAEYDWRPSDVCLIDMYTLTGLDICVGRRELSISMDYTSGTPVYSSGDRTLDSTAMMSLLSLLRTLQNNGTADDPDSAGDEMLSVTFHRDAGKYSEMKMSFYEFGDSYCLTEFNGYNHIVVLRSSVDSILEYINLLF